ncbi:MAG: signal recognition particle-docking protein FtsY [Erysipelotrichaceae bacterium]|nr:signal recognition particle-docking protein FtsY [Erysipelotrichaceae bacterium]
MSFFTKLKDKFAANRDKKHYLSGFKETSRSFNEKMRFLSEGYTECNNSFYEALMIVLIQSDLGINTAEKVISQLKKRIKRKDIPFAELQELLFETMASIYGDESFSMSYHEPVTVIFLVGVNGSGKTTTAAKLANYFLSQHKRVGVVAADTFRAGAIEQLARWAERLQIPCIRGRENSDPAASIVDGCRYALENGLEVLICDTAGRLQNKANLMNELTKMVKVAGREIPGAPHHVWLTIDASTGQNGLIQAKVFTEATNVSGIILTKMDGTAKGGIVLGIKDTLKIPVCFVGVGEKIDDLKEFALESYLYSIAEGINNVS